MKYRLGVMKLGRRRTAPSEHLFLAGEADAYHQSLRFAPPKVTRIATPKQGPSAPELAWS